MPEGKDLTLPSDFPEALRRIRERTPARILVGRAGAAYRTSTQMDLREAHAAARDAVRAEFESGFGAWRGVREAMESFRGLHRGGFQGRISPAAGSRTPFR